MIAWLVVSASCAPPPAELRREIRRKPEPSVIPDYFFKLKAMKPGPAVECDRWSVSRREHVLLHVVGDLQVSEMWNVECGDGLLEISPGAFFDYIAKMLMRVPGARNYRLNGISDLKASEVTVAALSYPANDERPQEGYALRQWPVGRVGPVSVTRASIWYYTVRHDGYRRFADDQLFRGELDFHCPDGTVSERCVHLQDVRALPRR
ncbi:MAG: hypothetical protein AB7S26_10495 [Sandaracinaceae bacterium]